MYVGSFDGTVYSNFNSLNQNIKEEYNKPVCASSPFPILVILRPDFLQIYVINW